MLANKDARGFLANFSGMTRHVIAVPIPGHDNAYTPQALTDAARPLGMRVETAESVEAALRAIAQLDLRRAAAHPDHGLAVSCGRSFAGQRHVAGVGKAAPRATANPSPSSPGLMPGDPRTSSGLEITALDSYWMTC